MARHRTARGTPFRSTIGMKITARRRSLALVADRHRVCVFEKVETEIGEALVLREMLVHPEGRMKGHELGEDRPGRSFDSNRQVRGTRVGAPRHGYSPAFGPEDHALRAIVEMSVELAARHGVAEPRTRLKVFAGPRLVGRLRPALEKIACPSQLSFEEKGYAWLSEPELQDRLAARMLRKRASTT